MNVNGLLTKRWLSHLESNQNSGYQKPVCSRYTMGQAELRILYHISFIRLPVRVHLTRRAVYSAMPACLPTCGLLRRNCAHPREMADSRVLATARHIHICLRVAVLRDSARFRGFRSAGGGEASRAWHPREFGAVLGGSTSLPLPAPPLPSSSRRYAPQCIVGEYTSSPCDVSHRASDKPRRRMSLSSALAPSSLASPSTRRVFLRCICARRRPASSLT